MSLSKADFMATIDNEGGWEYVACCYGHKGLVEALEADIETKHRLMLAFDALKAGVRGLETVTKGWADEGDDAS